MSAAGIDKQRDAAARFKLGAHVAVVSEGNETFVLGETFGLRLRDPDTSLTHALTLLQAGCTLGALLELLAPARLTALLVELQAHDVLVRPQESAFQGTALERVHDYVAVFEEDPDAALRRLSAKRVAVLGVGGIGCLVAQHVASSGVGYLLVLDDDRVALPDLNRQYLYTREDIGALKVDAAARRLVGAYPSLNVQALPIRVNGASELACLGEHDADMLVVAADQPIGEIDRFVDDYCQAAGLPYIVGGVGLERGFWGPLVVPGRTRSVHDFARAAVASEGQLEARICAKGRRTTQASFGPTNAAIAALMARDVVHFLLGSGRVPSIDARLVYDFASASVTTVVPG